MITALVVYQAWLCPQVWCCLIHHEGFSLLDSSKNYLLIGCVHHANTHQDGQSVMNLPPVETILFKLSSVFIELSSHPDMDLIPCSKRLIVVCSMFFLMDFSQLVKSDSEKKCSGIINDVHFITHIHAMNCAFQLQNKMVPQSVLVSASFQYSQLCDNIVQKS